MKNNAAIRVFVVEPRNSGGMIHYAYQLCSAFAHEGADVTLITARQDYEMDAFPHNFRVEKMLNLWSRVNERANTPPRNTLDAIQRKFFWTTRRIYRGLKLILSWFVLNRYLLRERPDIVQFGSIDFPFEAIFLAYLKKRSIVLTQISHEFEERERDLGLLSRIRYDMEAKVFENFSALFFHAQNNRERFKYLYPNTTENTHIIPMGNEQLFPMPDDLEAETAALRARYGLAPETHTILFFGTLTPSKGLRDLLSAFALIYKERQDVRLIVAGMPGAHFQIEDYLAYTAELGISEGVIYDTRYLPIKEVAPLMTLASVVAYPYLNSTQSAALQVAYNFSRPVIATNVGGLPESVVDGESGFLVPPADPNVLSHTILRFVEEPALTQRMGAFAKELSETRFAWNPIARRILDVYLPLIKRA